MNVSHPSVHPIEIRPDTGGGGGGVGGGGDENAGPRVRMKDIQGMPGTLLGLSLRLCQFAFAVVSVCIMASTSDFISVTAFCYLVAAAGLQSLWSLSLAIVDIYSILVKRCLRNYRIVSLFAIGDGVRNSVLVVIMNTQNFLVVQLTSTLIFAAASASAGITVLISNDLGLCAQNHCARFELATAMAYLSWFLVTPSFMLNFWSLASR
ncbi:hypothetical protein C5167_000444 [Papaver somniferum]|uniref:CASP-like protein n=1 Tax=Papaver somniferum TaxID=3469 RepID=A0A4Y7KSM5_PAPSO|nr:hypothetical protein C5167_000444 [Papaver somniferum]